MSLRPGRVVGSYEILAPLGAGGMGEVYRARDTRLGRQVAIKALPDGLARDEERLARFDREARALAAVNHPKIAAIYGLERTDDGPLLVLELVEGETLAERIGRGPLTPEDATAIAGQIAEALEAAHGQGIVHRDLKPANVKVREDGAVKVLDFGLAKAGAAGSNPVLSDSPTVSAADTRDGVILGTAAYMSPEQARGKAVDGRTDVWAFGCVLYEMLTGRLAFGGETVSDVIAAILGREPDWGALPPGTPAGLRRVLRRCLEKDPKRRFHHFADLRIELHEALDAPAPAEPPAGPPGRELRRWRAAALASGAALLAAGALAIAAWPRRAAPSAAGDLTLALQLTRLDGTETSSALAPDGRSFAFVSRHGGTPDVWVRQVAGGEPVRLTHDAEQEADLVYAPDGETIYFTRLEENGASVFRIGALGGQPRRVRAGARQPAPSPDGRRLAYYGTDGDVDALVVSALDGSDTRTLVRQVPGQNPRPAWSPDGRWLSYVTTGLFAPSNLLAVDTTSGEVRRVTRFTKGGEGVTAQKWLPDGRRLAVAYTAVGFTFQSDLGILDFERGDISRLTLSVDEAFGDLSLSSDGSRLAATAKRSRRELWKVPLRADPDSSGLAAERVMDDSRDPMWTFVSRDGRTLLFNSSMTGSRNLWTTALNGAEPPRQITAVSGDGVMHSSLSPDGTRVAFVSREAGHSDLWVQNVDGSNLRQITNDDPAESWPVWSPDGRWIAFNSLRDGRRETWRVAEDGGLPEKLVDGFFRGDWVPRPDGRGEWIVTSLGGPVESGVRLLDVESRSVLWERRLPGTALSLPVFSPDERSISLAGLDAQGRDVIWALDPASGEPRVLVRFPGLFRTYFRASWVDEGRALLVNRYIDVSRIVLFDRFWRNEGAVAR
ncbi:MAG: LpqB family beta-propeller domain-containing protein [Vicinamibacteria bacterium]